MRRRRIRGETVGLALVPRGWDGSFELSKCRRCDPGERSLRGGNLCRELQPWSDDNPQPWSLVPLKDIHPEIWDQFELNHRLFGTDPAAHWDRRAILVDFQRHQLAAWNKASTWFRSRPRWENLCLWQEEWNVGFDRVLFESPPERQNNRENGIRQRIIYVHLVHTWTHHENWGDQIHAGLTKPYTESKWWSSLKRYRDMWVTMVHSPRIKY